MRRFLRSEFGLEESEIGPIEKRKKYYAVLRVSFLQAWFCVSLSFFLSLVLSLSLCVCVFMRCVKFLLRKTN